MLLETVLTMLMCLQGNLLRGIDIRLRVAYNVRFISHFHTLVFGRQLPKNENITCQFFLCLLFTEKINFFLICITCKVGILLESDFLLNPYFSQSTKFSQLKLVLRS